MKTKKQPFKAAFLFDMNMYLKFAKLNPPATPALQGPFAEQAECLV